MPRSKKDYYPNIAAANPYRPSHWRWDRATDLSTTRKHLNPERDDLPTREATRFLRKLKGYSTEKGLKSLAKIYPAIVMAFKLYQEGGPRALEIRCRILARQTATTIAYAMGLTVNVVIAFRLQFFDIAERIDARSYITFNVAGMPLEGPPSVDRLS